MSMLNPPKTVSRRHELREDQLATATAKGLTIWEEHRRLLIGLGIGLVVLVIGAALYVVWQNQRDQAAAEELGLILIQYEQGQYAQALDGTADRPGLLEIADEYGSTDTGNLAAFYAADALFQLERYDEALTYFERYDAGDDILGASALAGQAAIKEQQGEPAEAARLYERAAAAYASPATAPDYLMAAGRAYTAAGDAESAAEVYEAFLEDYDASPSAPVVEALLAQVRAGQE